MKYVLMYLLYLLILCTKTMATLIFLQTPNESVSSLTGKTSLYYKATGRDDWRACWVFTQERIINWVFELFGDKDHCNRRIEPTPYHKAIWKWYPEEAKFVKKPTGYWEIVL